MMKEYRIELVDDTTFEVVSYVEFHAEPEYAKHLIQKIKESTVFPRLVEIVDITREVE